MIYVEVTDLFCVKPNYSYVRRFTLPEVENEKEPQTIRRAKRQAGIKDKHKKECYNDTITLYFNGFVMFITFD